MRQIAPPRMISAYSDAVVVGRRDPMVQMREVNELPFLANLPAGGFQADSSLAVFAGPSREELALVVAPDRCHEGLRFISTPPYSSGLAR